MPLGAHKVALFGVAGVSTGDVVLLSTQTASDSSSLDFTSEITSTYGEYIFKFYNINAATDETEFTFQCNATDSTSYDETITSTVIRTYQQEDDSGAALSYLTGSDQAQGTAYQDIAINIGNAADESLAGEFHLFNPSSTTYVKHFYSRSVSQQYAPTAGEHQIAGYINTTTAIDDIQFKMSSGNFDGTIKMWGVK